MIRRVCGLRVALALILIGAAVVPVGATTLIRMNLEDLVADNEMVVVGRVVDVHSRWNEEGTFILSDVRVAVDDVLKGLAGGQEITLTVMGGTAGDKTVTIVGGPELGLDSSYVLFLSRADLPGAPGTLTVRDLCQGTFDVVETASGRRAISQASRHPLLPDWRSSNEAPGGASGLALQELVSQVRSLASAR